MNPTVRWPDTTISTAIFCAPGVLTGLEVMAADGLMAIPRIGLGIGGLLLGKRDGTRIEILRSQEIPCSHALGPAFVLTAQEMAAGVEVVDGQEVVGWYCSKTREPLDLTEHDLALFDRFCPDAGQVVLVIRPLKAKVTKAAFGVGGEPGNAGIQMGQWLDLAWQELSACEVVEEKPAPAVPSSQDAEPLPRDSKFTEPRAQASDGQLFQEPERPAEPVMEQALVPVENDDIPIEMPSGTLFGSDESEPEYKTPSRWPRRILFAFIPLAILAAAAFFGRDYWIPKPPVALMASSDWSGRLSILWNQERVSVADLVTLVIDDGSGQVHTIHLNPSEVRVGWAQYVCRPGTVSITLLTEKFADSTTVKARNESYLPESGISK